MQIGFRAYLIAGDQNIKQLTDDLNTQLLLPYKPKNQALQDKFSGTKQIKASTFFHSFLIVFQWKFITR